MKDDVKIVKQLGCDGVVIGLLKSDGTIDKSRTSELVRLAYPMSVTFHRAFDRTSDPYQAMEDIIECGCERILTSGQQPTALEGASLICSLIEKAEGRIVIMPGSGVRASNIVALKEKTGAVEFHSSARTTSSSRMKFLSPTMNENLTNVILDEIEVESLVDILLHQVL